MPNDGYLQWLQNQETGGNPFGSGNLSGGSNWDPSQSGFYGSNFAPPSINTGGGYSTPGSNNAGAGSPGGGGGAGTFGFGNLVGGVIGGIETISALDNLKKLNSQPTPGYSVSPELQNAYSRDQGLASQGYTAAEKGAFQSNLNRGAEGNYERGVQMSGGNLANALKRSVNADELTAYDQFAASDAQLHRQNIQQADAMANQVQQQKNLIDQQKITQRNMLEQSYGNALNSGLENIGKSFNLGAIGGNLLSMAAA